MTNKYLEKIAAEKKKSNTHLGAAIVSSTVGSIVGGGAIEAARRPVVKHVIGKASQGHSDSGADLGTIKKFMKDNDLHKSTTFNTRRHSIDTNSAKGLIGQVFKAHTENGAHAHAPAFVPSKVVGGKKNFVVGVRGQGHPIKNHDITMHELGHAKDFKSFGKLKTALSLGRSPIVSGAATIAALSNDKTRDYAPAVAAVPGAMMLRDEAAANYHAYKGIKAHKGAAAANKFVKKLLPSQMGAYAIAAAAPVAGAYIAKKIMDKWHPKKDK